jgi:hypothetical protein
MALSINSKVNPIVATAVIIGIGILLIAFIRGCKNNQNNEAKLVNYESRINNLVQDSNETSKRLKDNNDQIKLLDGQLSLSSNKLLSLDEDLGKANDRINILLKKHVPIKPSLVDTGVITVPMRYVNECADCFEELTSGQKLVIQYKKEKENQFNLLSGKINLKDNRIRDLETANVKLTSNYRSLIDSSKKFQDKYKPHGRLYLSWGVLWKDYVPWAAGAGLMYQNKRNLIVGASWYYNSQGHMVQTNIHFPLSLRLK